MAWFELLQEIEPFDELPFDQTLVEALEGAAQRQPLGVLRFFTPTFRSYASDELKGCGKASFPAFSITGGACALNCDHCQAKILAPMIAATSPAELERKVRDLVLLKDLRGFLLSGGSNRRNEVPYERYYPTIEKLKRDFPYLRIAAHSALLDERRAKQMEAAGIDVAMTDVIGAQETIRDVYHLNRPVADFEATLAALTATSMEVVPHIVIGLHYGRLLGEENALDIVARYPIAALVLVVVTPIYAPAEKPFATVCHRRRCQGLCCRAQPDSPRARAAWLYSSPWPPQAGHRCLCRHGWFRRYSVSGRGNRGACPRHRSSDRTRPRLLFYRTGRFSRTARLRRIRSFYADRNAGHSCGRAWAGREPRRRDGSGRRSERRRAGTADDRRHAGAMRGIRSDADRARRAWRARSYGTKGHPHVDLRCRAAAGGH